MENYVNDEVKKIVHLRETGLIIFGKSLANEFVNLSKKYSPISIIEIFP